jgi:hypothetical protein
MHVQRLRQGISHVIQSKNSHSGTHEGKIGRKEKLEIRTQGGQKVGPTKNRGK